jgi:hypothetical protein
VRRIVDAFLLSVELARQPGRGARARAARALGVSRAQITAMLTERDEPGD